MVSPVVMVSQSSGELVEPCAALTNDEQILCLHSKMF
jgi:hypothetical protein